MTPLKEAGGSQPSSWRNAGFFFAVILVAFGIVRMSLQPEGGKAGENSGDKFAASLQAAAAGGYSIGVGSYDITGPAADVNLMGYANPEQIAKGIHMRLRARAFIVAAPPPAAGALGKRVVFVSIDACMTSQIVAMKVVERLRGRFGDLYTEQNVAISGTHSHSGPAGYLQYVLYIITSLGFVRQSFDAIVDGVERSIVRAHENIRPGKIFFNEGELLDANINRSPSAYENNPAEERARYKHNTDKTMTLLRFTDDSWGDVGAATWFAVHCTSMNNTNELLSSDNKGVASRFLEDWAEERRLSSAQSETKHDGSARVLGASDETGGDADVAASQATRPLPSATGGEPASHEDIMKARVRSRKGGVEGSNGPPPFVGAFAQSNVGDTSPNVLGAFCVDTGLPCDYNSSTCGGRNELCIGRGPGYPDYFVSTRVIAERQFEKGRDLLLSAKEELVGAVDYRHTFVDMSNVIVQLPGGGSAKTCAPSMGFSFAAGTTDGPGAFNFKQGDHQGNLFWKLVGGLIHPPSEEQKACQAPKPVLLDGGEIHVPYDWQPTILPIQILRIGQFIILACPGEFTTMSGRRLREAVKRTLIERGGGRFDEGTHVVIAGLANAYSSYVATFEEYQIQRYEGASTIYGPHTLQAYIQKFTELAAALAEGTEVPPGPSPPDLLHKQLEFLPPVVADGTPRGKKFGDIKVDVVCGNAATTMSAEKGCEFHAGDVVEAEFWTGCPRNDVFAEGTFALVERRRDSEDAWDPMYDDDDWSVRFYWQRPMPVSTESIARVWWEVPESAPPGIYRLRHYGAYKHFLGSRHHFTGASSAFQVVAKGRP